MSLSKLYDPSAVEKKWYAYWTEHNFFHSTPDLRPPSSTGYREPYTVVMPPPNVTGILHMGHMLNHTIQDVLVRRARMLGKNACWVPGTDHASIATEAKIVGQLAQLGQTKQEVGRERFLEMAFEWKEKYGGIILDQLKQLGASCDWQRTRFTMEPALSAAVTHEFIRLYQKGLIYRGARMINWDPTGMTAVSDEEVIYRPVESQLHYVRYPLENRSGSLTVATTRPETIMADVAIGVHPNDPRYTAYQGQKVWIPLFDRLIPIIADDQVSMDFGSGCLKITPAHSLSDYEIGLKHGLPIIDVLNTNGTLNEKAGPYEGLERFVARKKIIHDLDQAHCLEKTEPTTSQIGFSERTDAIIEPRISTQWFLRMEELAGPALSAFIADNGKPAAIKMIPDKFMNTYRHWLENIRDWCISRQLWWGQQIPAWYNPDGQFVVAESEDQARQLMEDKGWAAHSLVQDEDVLDTWFSSWLWPMSVFDGIEHPQNPDFTYYYPTDDLVTAPDILFFWVARMVMAGLDTTGKVPFRNVYLTGLVRDKQGRKMSKSLGNSPDPIGLIDQYGADALRVGLMLCSPAGNDLLYDESQVAQGRNFANKLWNAFRLIQSWQERVGDHSFAASSAERSAVDWFSTQLDTLMAESPTRYLHYRLSEELMCWYKLVWDDFCGWYLEMIKPVPGEQISRQTYDQTLVFFKAILQFLHPYMPFITEELWHVLDHSPTSLPVEHGAAYAGSMPGRSIMFSTLPVSGLQMADSQTATFMETIFKPSVTEVRNLRNTHQIPMKQGLTLGYGADRELSDYAGLYAKMAGITSFTLVNHPPDNSVAFEQGGYTFYLGVEGKLDKEAERNRILQEIGYTEGFLTSVMRKIDNPKFIDNARPEVRDLELKKRDDAQEKLLHLRESLYNLGFSSAGDPAGETS